MRKSRLITILFAVAFFILDGMGHFWPPMSIYRTMERVSGLYS